MTTGMETDIINQSDFGLKGRRVMNSGIRKILSDYNSLIKENDSIYRAAAKSSGISEAAFWILYMIRESGEDFTQNRICSEIHIPKQTVNSALSSLLKDGFIYLEQMSDRRSKKIILTDKGKALAESTVDTVIEAECKAFSGLETDERKELIGLFRKYTELFKKIMLKNGDE